MPLLLVHGWPETKRIFWRVIEPLAAAGFEVIVPDLRGFGDSDVGPDGFHDVRRHSRDLHALVHDAARPRPGRAASAATSAARSIQDLALRPPSWVDRMVLFNSPLPYDKERMAGHAHAPGREASDYFVRQGTDADALAAELATPEQRRRYIATFYTSRFWAHPGAFDAAPGRGRLPHRAVRRRAPSCGPASAATRASFDPATRSEPPLLGPQRPDAARCSCSARATT